MIIRNTIRLNSLHVIWQLTTSHGDSDGDDDDEDEITERREREKAKLKSPFDAH